MTISAVTFDLWDTVFDDESDEPKRAAQGLQSKPETRHALLLEAVQRHHDITRAEIDLAYGVANAAFYKVWQEASITWTNRERLGVLLKGLGKPLPDDELAALSANMERLEVDIPPDILPGVKDAIQRLSSRYRLCVVSDTIVTTGAGLREMLAHHDLLQYFTGFAFSDEVGRSKPHRAMFEAAREQMDVPFEEMVHIGDRDNKDIKGAQALGMKAILYTAKRDADRYSTSADAVCTDHKDLLGIIDALAED
ncbi:MAG: HAD family hydrolase [Rhodospirillales bacterium]|nr:HAD family hydrolase [Rhodospirillales bacterium]MBO6786211.1 HAD family hydrolase [Rhodospirillales bacterium]